MNANKIEALQKLSVLRAYLAARNKMAKFIYKISLQHLSATFATTIYIYKYLPNYALAYSNFLHYNDGNLWANKQKVQKKQIFRNGYIDEL